MSYTYDPKPTGTYSIAKDPNSALWDDELVDWDSDLFNWDSGIAVYSTSGDPKPTGNYTYDTKPS